MKWTVIWFAIALMVSTSAQDLTAENGLLDHLNGQDGETGDTNDQVSPDKSGDNTHDNERFSEESESAPTQNDGSNPPARPSRESDGIGLGETESESTEADSSDKNSEEDNGDTSIPSKSAEDGVHVSEEKMDEALVVQTSSGPIQGHAWEHNTNIISYIDVPYGVYAKAFESPVIAETKETVHNEKDHNKRCPQLDNDQYVGERDCLTLSIFKTLNLESVPVLFHIHDSEFLSGSGDPAIYGPDFLVPKGIILVLPNYRLGPLGFLCMSNETAPGNAGLKDLTLALHWVHKNIAAFGGDPTNIIVSGDGSSGALAGYLSLSPKSKDYISKVIIESGSVLSHWAFDRVPIVAATQLAEKLRIFEELDGVSPSELVTAAKDIIFRPCLETDNDESFMPESPWVMINRYGHKITFLIGSATHAGMHEAVAETTTSLQLLDEDPSLLLPNDLRFDTDAERVDTGKKVKAQYFGETININQMDQLALYSTDTGYLGPGIRAARRLIESGAIVYFYEFDFVGDFNRELVSLHPPIEGAVRGDIKGYLFTQDGKLPGDNTDEHHMMELLTELWKSFVNTGTPATENVVWNKLAKTDQEEEEWLSIKINPEMKTGMHVERLKLWTEIYDKYYIERSFAPGLSPSVYTVLVLQMIFWVACFMNAPHLY